MSEGLAEDRSKPRFGCADIWASLRAARSEINCARTWIPFLQPLGSPWACFTLLLPSFFELASQTAIRKIVPQQKEAGFKRHCSLGSI